MLVDLTQIPYNEIKPNSILVLRGPVGAMGNMEDVQPFLLKLREKVDPSVDILMMRADTEIFCVNEKTMNEAGWFKQTLPPSAPREGTETSV